MDSLILCRHCGRRIRRSDDLVTTLVLFGISPFHSACYSKALRGWETLWVSNEPVNGVSGTVVAGLSLVLSLVVLIGPFSLFLFLLLLVPPAMRLYSWLAFERPLQKS